MKPEAIDSIIEEAKRAKQAWVDGDYPLPEVLESCIERENLRFRIYPDPSSFKEDTNATDHLLELTMRAINGFRAERCVLTSDVFYSTAFAFAYWLDRHDRQLRQP